MLASIRMAIAKRNPSPGLIHHTGRGSQHARKCYRGVLRRAVINQSVSRTDSCYDIALMESCLLTLKNELNEYQNIRTDTKEISQFID